MIILHKEEVVEVMAYLLKPLRRQASVRSNKKQQLSNLLLPLSPKFFLPIFILAILIFNIQETPIFNNRFLLFHRPLYFRRLPLMRQDPSIREISLLISKQARSSWLWKQISFLK